MNVDLHPIEKKLLENRRSSSKEFPCPYCAEAFLHAAKLREHRKIVHGDSSNLEAETDKRQLRSQLQEEAVEKPSKPTRSKKHIRNTSQPTPSFGHVPASDPNAFNASSPRPGISDIPRDPGEKIGNLEKLTIGHAADHGMPTPNPLKRGLTDGPETLRMLPKNQPLGPTFRPGEALSVEPFILTDPDFARDGPMATGEEFPKKFSGVKRLYNPDLDIPTPYPGRAPVERTVVTALKPHRSPDTDSFQTTKPGELPHAVAGTESRTNVDTRRGARPGSAPTGRPISSTKSDREHPDNHRPPGGSHRDATQESQPKIIRQPETRPISHDQLVVEVKGIYAGLILVEQKCREVDEKQSAAALERDPARKAPLSNAQWQALIALHKTLLHEHHDFFLASQHPSASPTLSKLASKYSMPARMWRHGIHAFLEVLRHRLPASLDHMLAFIYIAYSMMALLYETVQAFEETWIECLGDLARYRMAIEEHDVQDREIWAGVATFWYSKAADKCPNIGRLYHHLAILARPNSLQQLAYYSRSLACVVPFVSARSSIMSLFQPVLQGKVTSQHRPRAFELAFISIYANLFAHELPTSEVQELFENIRSGLLDDYIGRVTTRFLEQGVSIALTNIAAIFEFGALGANQMSRSVFRVHFLQVWVEKLKEREMAKGMSASALDIDDDPQKSLLESLHQQIAHPPTEEAIAASSELVKFALHFTFTVLSIVLQRPGDKNVFPIVHVMFCFIWSLASVEQLLQYVERDIPWVDMCSFLNALAKPDAMTSKIWAKTLPTPDGGVTQPLPEDYAMRGQLCALWYYPDGWFETVHIDIEERCLEVPSMAASRIERILWLGMGIAEHNRWISYDQLSMRFEITK